MVQKWLGITFLHWRVPADQIASKLPRGLEPDTFDGSAWVGVTPFYLDDLRPPHLPALAWISRFPETNVRTYVRARNGSTGIWFFSLDAARAAACVAARVTYGLPYVWSRMAVHRFGDRINYRAGRLWPGRAYQDIEVECAGPARKDEVATFLTERYRLFSTIAGTLVYAPVEHVPWPLREVRATRVHQTLTGAVGLSLNGGPELVHFSEGVETRVGACRPVA